MAVTLNVALGITGTATISLVALLAVADFEWSQAQPIKKQQVIDPIIVRSAFMIQVCDETWPDNIHWLRPEAMVEPRIKFLPATEQTC